MAKQERLSNDEFLARLSKYLNTHSTNLSGSIHLTQKRLSHPQSTPDSSSSPTTQPSTSPFPDLNLSQPLPVLMRATNGKSQRDTPPTATNKSKSSSTSSASRAKEKAPAAAAEQKKKWKISTVVEPDEIDAFFVRYGEVWRKEMSVLKKRDRKKRKKERKGGVVA